MASRRFAIEAVFKGIDRISRPLNKMQNSVHKFTRKMQRGMRSANRAATKVAKTLTRGLKVGFAVATTAAVGFAAAMRKIITVGAGFEKTIVAAAVKFPGKIRAGTAAFKELEDAAREVGSTTEFTASQSAEALNFLAMAGFGAKQSIGALPKIVDLATIANIDLGRASDIATDTLGKLGLATDDLAQQDKNLTRVTDVLAETSVRANTSVDQLFEALIEGGGTATDVGASIETLGAFIGVLGNAGTKGSKAGTHLKNVFLGLAAATPKAKRALHGLGVKVADGSGNMRDMTEILDDLNGSLSKLGNVERAAKLRDIFGKIPIESVGILLKAGGEKLRDFRTKLEGAGGAAKEMASVMRDTTQGSIDSLTSAIEGGVISIFKMDLGIRPIIDGMTKWVRENEKLIASKVGDFFKYIADNFGLIAERIKQVGIVIGIIYGLVSAIKALSAVLILVNLIMAANPLTLTLIALAAVVALTAAAIINNWDDIVLFFKWSWKFIVDLFDSAVDAIQSAWGPITDFFADLWNGVVSVFEDIINSLLTTGPISWIIAAVALLMKYWEPIVDFFVDIWQAVYDVVAPVVKMIIENGPIGWVIDAVKLIIDNWSSIVGFFKKIWDNITSIFNTGYDVALKPLLEKVETFIEAFKLVWTGLKLFFSSLWEGIKNIFTEKIDQIKSVFAPLLNFFGGISDAKDALIDEQVGQVDLGGLKIDGEGAAGPQTVSPQERLSRSIEERRESSTAQVTIRDETGRAEVTEGDLGKGISFEPMGGF